VVTVRRAQDPEARRVVVGIDRTPEASEAIAFAFQLASDLRVDLTAIHTWNAPSLYGAGAELLPMPTDVGTDVHEQHQALADDLATWQQKFPAVPLTIEAIPGRAAAVLVDASEHAEIVVVGSRQRQSVSGLILGSVSEKVLHHARCPVVIARGPSTPGGI
jgi:nucleotide-binding universal stress UspA family protein